MDQESSDAIEIVKGEEGKYSEDKTLREEQDLLTQLVKYPAEAVP